MLESAQVPDQQATLATVRREIKGLGAECIHRVKVYGRQTGEDFLAWSWQFELVVQRLPESIMNTGTQSSGYRAQSKKSSKHINANDYRVPQEKEVLYLGLGALGFIFLILLKITLGWIIGVVVISALWVKVSQSQLLGGCVKVSEYQLPEVYQAAIVASERLSMRMPDIFVKHSPEFNAYAIGFLNDRKTIVLYSALVEAMDEDELTSIIGHEFSHIKCNHTDWIVLTSSTENVARIPLISDIVGFAFLLWSRKCEYTCDRGGLLASRNLKASISALAKLTVGKELFEKINLDTLLTQKKDIDADEVTRISETFGTHPYLINRIHKLKEFYESNLYKKLRVQ